MVHQPGRREGWYEAGGVWEYRPDGRNVVGVVRLTEKATRYQAWAHGRWRGVFGSLLRAQDWVERLV